MQRTDVANESLPSAEHRSSESAAVPMRAVRLHRDEDPTEVTSLQLRTELARMEHERDLATAARDAECEQVASLQESVACLQEQLRSARAYDAAARDADVLTLLAEREALLQEIAVLNDEL